MPEALDGELPFTIHHSLNYHSVLTTACEVSGNGPDVCLVHEETETQREELSCVRGRVGSERVWDADLPSSEPRATHPHS